LGVGSDCRTKRCAIGGKYAPVHYASQACRTVAPRCRF
jgi:hypothetical protein